MASAAENIDLKIIATTDVHGNFFPYNFIERHDWTGSLARVAAFVDSTRQSVGRDNVILLDNGDLLQGQPTAYYYNFIDTVTPHLAAQALNFMDYDAVVLGNHDFETGHEVYDRYVDLLKAPTLGANVIDTATGQPYLKPYTIIERQGVKIAIVGLVTPAIPAWLPENLWSGLEFKEMLPVAREVAEHLREAEKPDVIIGLFHSGADSENGTDGFIENASLLVAQETSGFDAIIFGHDHERYCGTLLNAGSESVVAVNPANNAMAVGVIDIRLKLDPAGNVVGKQVKGSIADIVAIRPSKKFTEAFAAERRKVKDFVSRKIGQSEGSFSIRDAYFGPSAFMELIHRLQLDISGADISFAAPLSFDGEIAQGPIRVSDMFTLYKYENLLYTMQLTGKEIKGYLEESYNLWTRQTQSADEHIIQFAESDMPANRRLLNASYNFDSAMGIDYEVDVTKPYGDKIRILRLSDGTPFDPEATYKVAINSYRANGGGDLLTKGAGIPREQLKSRIITSTDKDLRYYFLKEIEKQGKIAPRVTENWRFVPEEITRPALEADRKALFP